MPRPTWSGSINFGLVSIPVKLFGAVSHKSVRFNQIDVESGSRIKQKKVSASTGEEVPNDRIVKGYEVSSGNYVQITSEELAALDPEAQRTIEIAQFVDAGEIDPIMYDSAYYLAPSGDIAKPYRLLADALAEADKVGIARFVMRSKEHVAAVRSVDGVLVLSTMVYADEVNDPASISELDGLEDVETSDMELQMANQLIESLTAPFDASEFKDGHRERILHLIEQKAVGATEAPEAGAAASDDDVVVDLMAALEASVAQAKEARKRHPSAKKAAAKKKPAATKAAKKPAAKRARKSA